MSSPEPLSTKMRVAVGLLELFVVAIVVAFAITLATGSAEVRVLSTALISPVIILSLVFIHFCRKRRAWSYAGATVLGVFGVALRVAVSTQPSLEVGGGLPQSVTALYIVLGALVALMNFASLMELRR